jgi:two-component system chemotaxis response regulator CheB
MRDELLAKVDVVRALRPMPRPAIKPTTGGFTTLSAAAAAGILARTSQPPASGSATPPAPRPPPNTTRTAPRRLVVIASSTGGPQALLDLVGRIPASSQQGIVIAQHMPERFTRTFAERLARRSSLRVAEADDGAFVDAGTVWVCPGGRVSEIEADPSGVPRVRVQMPEGGDRYLPSADRLFRSAAAAWGPRVLAVVLTGMGDDGASALVAVKKSGGELWVEAAESAIVDGMPAAARKSGLADQVLPLGALITRLAAL